ncbi:hypothetical protein NP493_580g00020 [Ridgeia piscesae]|uniref:Uncharacterized protein n=1 Tax=Ridgeia piscesae TaxID=27915 RepID=A0AAD9KVQ8_RIDPI|nr:hypothetical protein NP493_580g00020 [Ridgeia piscesae]
MCRAVNLWRLRPKHKVSYRTLLIALGVVAGVVLLAVSITCYCCCCRQSKASLKKRLTRDNIQQEREEEERRAKHAARRAERQNKYDEIRQKYELLSEVKCLTENMKKDLEGERGLPSVPKAQGDGENGSFSFTPAAIDPIDHRGVMAGETASADVPSAAILPPPPPPPVVRRRSKRSLTRTPRQFLSKTHSLVVCPYHHGSLVGGAGHLSPFEARLRRRAREERRRREEREHQLELLADMARMIAGTDDLHRHCVECRRLPSTVSMPAAQGRLYRGGSSSLYYNCKECRCKKY